MKINLNTLYKPILIDDDFVIAKEWYEKVGVLELKNVHAKGKVWYNLTSEVEIVLDVTGVMILEDAVNLEALSYPFSFKIEENLTENEENNQNILDINEFLWENIVLEVPIRVTSCEDERIKGNGWQLNGEISNEENNQEMSKLNDLLKGGEEEDGSSF